MQDQEIPSLVLDEALLEPQLTAFDLGKDLLQLAKGLFKTPGRGLGFFKCHA